MKNPHVVLMARLFCVVLMLGVMACASSSEQRKPPAIKAKSADDVMADIVLRLKLTEEQRGTVKPIIQSYADRRSDLLVNALQGGGSNLKESFQYLRTDTEKMMAVVISEDQMKEFRKYLDEEQQKMDESKQGRKGGGRSGGRGGGRGGGFGGGMGGFGR